MPITDQGVNDKRYNMIPRTLIFGWCGEDVLLIQNSSDKKTWPNLFNGIGGHVEKGEDIKTAACREFLEETGTPLLDPVLRAIISIDTGATTGIILFVFQSEIKKVPTQASPEGKLKWVPIKDLTALPLVEDLPVLIPKIFSLPIESAPLFGQYFYDINGQLCVKI